MEQVNISDSLKEKIAQAETLEQVAKVCAEEGLDVTLEDLKAAEASQKDELNEDDLDNVAGGLVWAPIGLGIAAYLVWKAARKGGGGHRF